MKKYTIACMLLLCSCLLFMSACGSSNTGGRTNDSAYATKATSATVHSGSCFTRDGQLAGPADLGQSVEPPRWQSGSSPYLGAQLNSCSDAISLSWSGNFDLYQIIWTRPGMIEQQFTTHWQTGVDITGAHFRTTYSFKVEGCNNNFWTGLSCSSWSPTVKVATYYPGDCYEGYVWRGAFDGDQVCVIPATRAQAVNDNTWAASRVDPQGAYGPYSCRIGFVWRGIVASDHVCVLPAIRDQVVYDNAHAYQHTYN